MAHQCGDACRFHATRTAAHHRDVFRRRGGNDQFLGQRALLSRRRIDGTAEPRHAHDAADAALVAGDARPYAIGVTGARLGDQLRIGNQRAHIADHIGITILQHLFAFFQRAETSRDDARHLDVFQKRACVRQVVSHR